MGRIGFGFKPATGVGKLKFTPGHMFAPQFDKTVAAMKVNKGAFPKPKSVKVAFKSPRRVKGMA
jgi:hypothetical protein